MGNLLSTNWIKTRRAQKLLVRVKFTDNPYSYVCERPSLKYMQMADTRRVVLVQDLVTVNAPLVQLKLLRVINGYPDSYS